MTAVKSYEVNPVTPAVVCPLWCTVSKAEHVADLSDWDGMVIHWSTDRHGGGLAARIGLTASPDGTPDPRDPVQVHLETTPDNGITLDEAARYARMILALVAEARS